MNKVINIKKNGNLKLEKQKQKNWYCSDRGINFDTLWCWDSTSTS